MQWAVRGDSFADVFDHLVPTKIYANAFPVVERDGYAWVYVPPAGAGRVEDLSGLPPVPELPKFGKRYRSAHLTAELPCNVDHGIIGLMDPAHGPFVHRAWWWRSAASIHEKTKKFEPLEDSEHGGRNAGFRMSAHAPSSNSAPYKLLGKPVTTIDFVLPNRRYETIRAVNAKGRERWFASLTTVTPVTATSCRIDVMLRGILRIGCRLSRRLRGTLGRSLWRRISRRWWSRRGG